MERTRQTESERGRESERKTERETESTRARQRERQRKRRIFSDTRKVEGINPTYRIVCILRKCKYKSYIPSAHYKNGSRSYTYRLHIEKMQVEIEKMQVEIIHIVCILKMKVQVLYMGWLRLVGSLQS